MFASRSQKKSDEDKSGEFFPRRTSEYARALFCVWKTFDFDKFEIHYSPWKISSIHQLMICYKNNYFILVWWKINTTKSVFFPYYFSRIKKTTLHTKIVVQLWETRFILHIYKSFIYFYIFIHCFSFICHQFFCIRSSYNSIYRLLIHH